MWSYSAPILRLEKAHTTVWKLDLLYLKLWKMLGIMPELILIYGGIFLSNCEIKSAGQVAKYTFKFNNSNTKLTCLRFSKSTINTRPAAVDLALISFLWSLSICSILIHLRQTFLFYCPWNPFGVFRGYRNEASVWNGLNKSFSLREKCPYSEFFWPECGKIRTRKKSEYGHFSRSVLLFTWNIDRKMQ